MMLFSISLHAADARDPKPSIGIAWIEAGSVRAQVSCPVIESHLNTIIASLKIFDVSPLKDELKKFGCMEERCLVQFAQDAGINLAVAGKLDDQGDTLILVLSAYGTALPYNGRLIYRYSLKIDANERLGTLNTSYLFEEHVSRFIIGILKNYKHPLFMVVDDNGRARSNSALSGSYDLFEAFPSKDKGFKSFRKKGRVTLKNGLQVSGDAVNKGDFVLHSFEDSSRRMTEISHIRKSEMVFQKSSPWQVLYGVLFTVPASSLMPVAAPLIYYGKKDWQGIVLWSVNSVPYLYLEISGFKNNLNSIRKRKSDASRSDVAKSRYAYYMLFTGGLSLTVDAIGHRDIEDTSKFKKAPPYLGSPYIAAFFSIAGGGAGHFYKGDRFWGYAFFHLDNIMMYYTLKEFSSSRRYNFITKSYVTAPYSRKRAYTFLGIAGAIRIFEFAHVLLMKDRIESGDPDETTFEPVVYSDRESRITTGIAWNYNF